MVGSHNLSKNTLDASFIRYAYYRVNIIIKWIVIFQVVGNVVIVII